MMVAEWLDLWYNTYVVPEKRLAASTKACYRRAVEAVPAWLGAMSLEEQLLPLHLHRWLTEVSAQHPRAAQLDRVMLSKALRIAGKLGLCAKGIIDQDTVPKPVHAPKEAAVLTFDQARAYLVAAKSSPCYPLLALCLCGLRRGEALGARWQDLEGDVLHVRRQRQRMNRSYRTVPLKTPKSRRSLQLPPWLIADLQTRPKTITGWIVDTTPEGLQAAHKAVLAAAQLPHVTLHGLRHTFATLAAAQGRPMKHLQLALGHSKLKLTADLYADHLTPLSSLPHLVWLAV